MKNLFFAILFASSSLFAQSQLEVVATCLIREAGGRGECMASVMHVISNRAKAQNFASYHRVVTRPWQFESIHKQNIPRIVARAKKHPRWNEAVNLVRLATQGNLPYTAAQNANHFFNPSVVSPRWARNMTFVARIGGHDFYRD